MIFLTKKIKEDNRDFLAMQGAQVQSLVRELDPACHNHKILRATTEIQLAK